MTIRAAGQLSEELYTLPDGIIDPHFSDVLLTVTEVADLLKIPVSWVYARTRRRGIDRIPHFKLGKYLRFSKEDIKKWLERTRGI